MKPVNRRIFMCEIDETWLEYCIENLLKYLINFKIKIFEYKVYYFMYTYI